MELKPCPFCGGDAVLFERTARKGFEAYIACNGSCLATMDSITYDTQGEAVEAVTEKWNRRVGEGEKDGNQENL